MIDNIQIKGVWLPFFAFSIEGAAQIALNGSNDSIKGYILSYSLTLMVLVYSLLVAFFVLNLKIPGVPVLLTGVVLNMIVIFSNGGSMPVDIDMAASYGFNETVRHLSSGLIFGHSAIVPGTTQLSFLGDVLHLRPPYPMPKSVSIGDLIMDVGIMLVFILNLRERSGERKEVNMTQEEETHVY